MNNVINHLTKFSFGKRHQCPEGYEEYNEDWCLTPDGDMYNVLSDYEIGSNMLYKDDWILHLSEKRWFDANTFIPAYFEACRRKGISLVMIRTHYC